MTGRDKEWVETRHQLVKRHTTLGARTWYGMPAYNTSADGKVIVSFQSAAKFEARYATIGFQQDANLDEVIEARGAQQRRCVSGVDNSFP